MTLITWDSNYSVKVAEIDKQHQKLIDLINELNDAMKEGKGKDIMSKIISNLAAYTNTHFTTEERYFEKFGYPESAGHKKEHADFVQKIAEFKDGFEQKKLSLTIEVMNFLKNWLNNHINISDKKYSQFFNDNGLT